MGRDDVSVTMWVVAVRASSAGASTDACSGPHWEDLGKPRGLRIQRVRARLGVQIALVSLLLVLLLLC